MLKEMKKNGLFIMIAVAAMMAVFACNKDTEPEVTPGETTEEEKEVEPEPPVYEVTAEKPYVNMQQLLDETGLLAALGGSGQIVIDVNFPDQGNPASAISYVYHSVDPQGKPVDLSAVIYITTAALEGTTPLKGISLTNHGTIASNAQCPTNAAQFEGALAWKNYAIIMPDYYGFGKSSDRPQGYLDAENTARNSIDAYIAAVELLKDREVEIPDNLYSLGYSQGGFNSMANLKYVSEHPELGISFSKVFCGGSPFDMELTWDKYTDGTFHNYLAFVPMTLVSINETQKLGLDYADLFKGALLANYREWILSKKYTTNEISAFLSPDPKNPTPISAFLNDNLINRTGSAYDAIMSVVGRYSLTSGWVPSAGSSIFLFHSTQDDTVPYDNLPAMTAFLDSVAGPDSYTVIDGEFGGHMDAVLWFILRTIGEW